MHGRMDYLRGGGGLGGLGREEGDKLQEQQKFGLWGAHVTKL